MISYVTRFAYVLRNVKPVDFADELQQLNATRVAALAAVMQEPDAVDWAAEVIRSPE
jgi:hypothetical protein